MMKRIVMALIATLVFVGAAATVTGCNTVEGVGKDIHKTGEVIEEEARENR